MGILSICREIFVRGDYVHLTKNKWGFRPSGGGFLSGGLCPPKKANGDSVHLEGDFCQGGLYPPNKKQMRFLSIWRGIFVRGDYVHLTKCGDSVHLEGYFVRGIMAT